MAARSAREKSANSMLHTNHLFDIDGLAFHRAAAVALTGRVLLVDHRRDVRITISLFLSSLGLQVTTADDGRDALETAILADNVGYGFHLILMNIAMPGIDGLEATVLFRHAEYDGQIIAISEGSGEDVREQCIDAGCDEVLSTPQDADRFYQALERHLHIAAAYEARAA